MTKEEKEKLIKIAELRADIREMLRNDPKAAARALGIELSDAEATKIKEGVAEDELDDRFLAIAVVSRSKGKKKPARNDSDQSGS